MASEMPSMYSLAIHLRSIPCMTRLVKRRGWRGWPAMPVWTPPIGGKVPLPPVKKNPRFADVPSCVHSGWTEQRRQVAESAARCSGGSRNRGENFQRITVGQLEQLRDANEIEVLLLDLRDEQEFETYQISGAVNYPVRLLSRSMNPFTPDIPEFRNREPDRIIVLCDASMAAAVAAANRFFEMGVDNIFLLSGGLEAVVEQASYMIEGTPPPVLQRQRGSSQRDSTNTRSVCSMSRAPSAQNPSSGVSLGRRTTMGQSPRATVASLSAEPHGRWKA